MTDNRLSDYSHTNFDKFCCFTSLPIAEKQNLTQNSELRTLTDHFLVMRKYRDLICENIQV